MGGLFKNVKVRMITCLPLYGNKSYHNCCAINFNWFLHLSTDLFTLTLSITFVSPFWSNSIGLDSIEEIRPDPRKSSSINKWFSGSALCRNRHSADDFVVCFQYKSDADMFYEILKKRMGNFGLSLEEEKSRLIEFGRYAESQSDSCWILSLLRYYW